jgi:hypothetical protein
VLQIPRRHISAKVLVAITAVVLLCTIAAAEFPELLSLADNTSNDFAMHKAPSRECMLMLHAARNKPMRFSLDASECGEQLRRADGVAGASLISSDLLVLHSVLRT